MSEPRPAGWQALLAELKRRRVFRVAAVYGAAGFVVLQVMDLLVPVLLLPGWTYRLVGLLLLAGLPVAVALAWVFDWTPEGVQRTNSEPSTTGAGERWFSARTVVLVIGLLAVGGAGGWLLRPGGAIPGDDGGRATLAVLPFTNLGAAGDEYFADGVSDALRGKLAGIDGLVVIASSSTRPYKGTSKSPQEIGSELGVRYLLTGTVHWARSAEGASRVQVSPELIAAESGTTEWQQPFDAVLSDVFTVQGEIAGRVADALSVTLLEPERRALSERPTENLEAYDAYLRASALLHEADLGAATQRLAAEGFRHAVELDPHVALAWAQLSYAHMGAYWFYEDASAARLRLARGAADTALALGPELPEAWLADGYYWYWGWRSYDRALAAFERARDLGAAGPADEAIGNVLRRQGRWTDAAEHYRRALALDPRDAALHRELALTLITTGDLDDADRLSARAITLAPGAIGNYMFRSQVLYAREDVAGADATIREGMRVIGTERFARELTERSWTRWLAFTDTIAWRALEHLPLTSQVVDTGSFHLFHAEWLRYTGRAARAAAVADSAMPFLERSAREAADEWWFHGQLALAHALAGRQDDAFATSKASLATLDRLPDAWDGPAARYHAAKVALILGDGEAAIAHLTAALASPSRVPPAFVRVDGRFAALRGDPRYEALVKAR